MPPRGWAKLTAMPHAVMGVRHGWGWNGKSNVSLRVKRYVGVKGYAGDTCRGGRAQENHVPAALTRES